MDRKRIGRKLLFPPVWLTVILVSVSAVTLSVALIVNANKEIRRIKDGE